MVAALSVFTALITALLLLVAPSRAGFPKKIYGVNLGSWLLIEPWMLPDEWVAMGGQQCDRCHECIASEFEFAKAYPDTVDATFDKHWSTWFTQQDVDKLVQARINTVRIPLGYWIVEELVDRKTEYYARGGLRQLKRGLKQLKKAGIAVILDHHALPGVQTPNQMFAGRCTEDVQFYTPYNYKRALIWTAVMTALSHLDPDFSSVVSIHAVNEPIMNADLTPGYGDFQKDFVRVVRSVEAVLGLGVPQNVLETSIPLSRTNFTAAVEQLSDTPSISSLSEIVSVLKATIPILFKLEIGLNPFKVSQREPLTTDFMDVSWQYNNPSNPADAALGPQNYDNHLYYSFGGVADPNEEAYLTHLCNLDRVKNAIANRNVPLFFGEWSLATQFEASDEFLKRWADAQKLQYGKDAGWIFWNFKIETTANTARQWSYFEGLRRGYLTQDPAGFHNPHVCDNYTVPQM